MKIKLKICLLFFLVLNKMSAQQSPNPENGSNIDVTYHYLQVEVDPAVYYIKGMVNTFFKTKVTGVSTITFDLSTVLTVDSVLFHAKKTSFLHSSEKLSITIPKIQDINSIDSVCVFYHGAPSTGNGFGAFTTNFHNNTPVMWTLSEPYGAKDWWPCKQSLDDKADSIDILIIHPAQYKAAANGVLVSETISGDKMITHWKHRHSISAYLVAFAVTNYSVYSDYVPAGVNDSIEILNYVYPENLQKAKTQTPATIGIMQLYNNRFIKYPFANEKYGHAQFGWGGGMEHQTMSFMYGFDPGLIAHELAHQWFGDYITCAGWKNIWLNEGFATWCESLCIENGLINRDWNSWKRGEIEFITSEPDGSLIVDDTNSVYRIFDSRLSYTKGGMVLHMLRWELGDSVFFKGIYNYLNDSRVANSYASTENFQQILEASSGKNLSYFFNEWVYGQGYPTYTITWGQDDKKFGVVRINQIQSHKSVKYFELNIPVKFAGEGKDTTLVFRNTFSGQEFPWELNFKVSSVYFDPDVWLISPPALIQQLKLASQSEKIILSPNPVKNKLSVRTYENYSFDSVVIFNLSGKKVKEYGKSESGKSFIFDVSDLPQGYYFVLLNSKNNKIVRKIVKE
ncbi:MAG: M1 family aminopeptidase [Bacteroidales bacterium]